MKGDEKIGGAAPSKQLDDGHGAADADGAANGGSGAEPGLGQADVSAPAPTTKPAHDGSRAPPRDPAHPAAATNPAAAEDTKRRGRSRSRSRGRRRSRSVDRQHHGSHYHHRHHHHRSGSREGRGRSPGGGHARGHGHAHAHGNHRSNGHHSHSHRRRSRSHGRKRSASRSRSRGRRRGSKSRSRSRPRHGHGHGHGHHRHRSRSRSAGHGGAAAAHHHHRHHEHGGGGGGGGGAAGRSPSPAGTPTARRVVQHESTLVALRPSASPRSAIPVAAFEAAADLLKSPAAAPRRAAPRLGPLAFGAAQAKGMRPYMEDRHIVLEPMLPRGSSGAPLPDDTPRAFAAVYDGHNGTLAADHAAERLHYILAAEPALRTVTGEGPPAAAHRESERMTAALVHAFEATDKEIMARCRAESGRGGATGVVVLRVGLTLYAAHCGDSRAVMCRGGQALRLTEDHKPNLPRERKRVEDLGGRVDFARCWRVIVDPGGGRPASGLAVSRSFGDPDFKEPLHLVTATPDVMSERLTEEDAFVILASDGLWDVMSDCEACQLVAAKLEGARAGGGGHLLHRGARDDELAAALAAEALVQAALDAGTMDNVTAVVGLLNWSSDEEERGREGAAPLNAARLG